MTSHQSTALATLVLVFANEVPVVVLNSPITSLNNNIRSTKRLIFLTFFKLNNQQDFIT